MAGLHTIDREGVAGGGGGGGGGGGIGDGCAEAGIWDMVVVVVIR
jgi:hypothetical protein